MQQGIGRVGWKYGVCTVGGGGGVGWLERNWLWVKSFGAADTSEGGDTFTIDGIKQTQ